MIQTNQLLSGRTLREFLSVGSDTLTVLELPNVNAALGTTRGPVRKQNQDRAIILRSSYSTNRLSQFLMFAISDGIGGMTAGGERAQLTLTAISNTLVHSTETDAKIRLKRAFKETNSIVFDKYKGESGTTLSVLLI